MDAKRLIIKNKAFYLPPFYLTIDDMCGYFEENNGSKYLILISCHKDQDEIYSECMKLWEEIKNSIIEVTYNKFSDYDKCYSLIKFDSDDNLPLNKKIKINTLTIIIRSVLEKDGGYYSQIF